MEEGRYLVLGTAGHIDHGKTSLVKALTGVDTDRFTEEKERGITIDIGFAKYISPSGVTFGIVDVPGHAKFIRNMVAGAIGIDLIILVIAADDGVMPQTREHLHIARLLGVKAGLVALTKCDMVDSDLLELSQADVEELIENTFLAGCPIIPVSSTKGTGLTELAAALDEVASKVPSKSLGDRFRMPIDRSFSIKGAGTVVTGTTVAGLLKPDDEVQIMPNGKKARVRGIQVHGQPVVSVEPGHRTAINLVGVDKGDMQRGNVLVEPDSITSTYMFDAQVDILPGKFKPLRSGSEVLLHVGTMETTARLHPLDDLLLHPDSTGMVQFRAANELALAVGDRFIIRSSTAEFTIGGGTVLDPHPTKHRRKRQDAAQQLVELVGADEVAALKHEVLKTPFGIEKAELTRLLNTSQEKVDQILGHTGGDGSPLQSHTEGQRVFVTANENRMRIIRECMTAINTFHGNNPMLNKGLGLKEMAKLFSEPGVPSKLVSECLGMALQEGKLRQVDDTYALAGHEIKISLKDKKASEFILKEMGSSLTPPQPDEMVADVGLDKARLKGVVSFLIESGELVQVPGGMLFTPGAIERCEQQLRNHFKRAPGVTVSDFNKLAGTSRKYGIPLLQYFEQSGLLKRDGDLRVLNE